MVTCPACDHEMKVYVDEDADDEEYGPRIECPECGFEFDPDTA